MPPRFVYNSGQVATFPLSDKNMRKRALYIILSAVLLGPVVGHAGYSAWTVEGGPYGARVHDFYEMPDDPRTIYIGTERAGVLVSRGDGNGWIPLNNGFSTTDVLAITADPSALDSMFAATGGGGVYRSANRGDSWFPANNGLPSLNVRDLTFDAAGYALYAATGGSGVYKSVDRGANWTSANSGLFENSIHSITFAPSDPTRWYLGTAQGVFRSTNGASTWALVSVGLTTTPITDVLVDPANRDVVYAASAGGGVFRSTNGGLNWAPYATGMGAAYVEEIEANPSDFSELWAATRVGVFGTTDGGANWSLQNAGIADTISYAVHVTADTLFAGSYWEGVHCAPNTGVLSWTPLVAGLSSRFVWEITPSPHNPAVVWAASYGGVSVSTDTGWTWSESSTGIDVFDLRSVQFDPNNPSVLLAGAFYGGAFRSTDAGASWTASSGLGAGTVSDILYKDASSSIVVAGTYNGPYRSVDGGVTWTLSSTGMGNHKVWGLAGTPADTDLLIAGTYGDGMFRSDDFGQTWTALSAPDNFVRAVAIDAANPNVIYAGGYYQDSGLGGVYRSVDGGANWAPKNNGLGNLSLWGLHIDPANSAHIFAATADGIYETFDSGDTWADFSLGLFARDVRSLGFVSDRLVAGTYGGSAPWYEEATVSVGDGAPRVAFDFRNAPNPFNPFTTFRADIAGGPIRLDVFDVRGRLVRTLLEGNRTAGALRVDWDGTDGRGRALPSGVYFGRLETTQGITSRTLHLIR